jgi:hypothetical protein
MRKRLLGSLAALVAGAGAAYAQPPVEPSGSAPGLPPSLTAPLGPVAPQPPLGGPPKFGGFPANAIPGNAGVAPPATVMPPGNYGPAFDPLGIGPVGGFGPPPAPMYPMPGPPGAQAWQPLPSDLTAPGAGGDGHGGGGGYCGAPHWWFDGEYLLWFTNGQRVRYPLATTSAPSDAGVLGAASTTVLSGQRDLGYNAMSGFRLSAGFFGDADRRIGFQLTGFYVAPSSNRQSYGAVGSPLLAGLPVLGRPFIDATSGAQSAIVLSGPDFAASRVFVGAYTQTWGMEPVGVWNIYRSDPGSRAPWSIDFLAGYKFVQVKEELRVQSWTQMDANAALPVFVTGPFGIITQLPAVTTAAQTVFGGATVGGPALITIEDRFRTTNNFNGFVLGLKGRGQYGIVTLDGYAKAAIGDMHERVQISGGGSFFDPTRRSGTTPGVLNGFNLGVGGGVGSVVGGVLANAGNIGTYNRDRFAVIPEIGGNIGLAVTRGLTLYTGVSAMYFSDIARPGDQVNPVVSSAAIPFSANYGAPGAPRSPFYQIRETSHWLGGVNFGLRLQY